MSNLHEDLRSLEALVEVPEAPDVADAVLARTGALPVPRASARQRLLGRWRDVRRRLGRWIWAGLLAVLVALGSAAPVRAQVAEWFSYLGVLVRVTGDPAPTTTPSVPTAAPGMSLARAGELVGVEPVVPALLGAPDGVEVSADRRVLSLTWGQGADVVRLDQFAGRLDPVFAKTAATAEFVTLPGDRMGLWFEGPHEVVVLTPTGARRTAPPRLASPTLVWEREGVTLRLEGDLTLERALEIATG